MDKQTLIRHYGVSSDTQLIELANKLNIKLRYVGFAENLPALSKLDGSYIINLGDFERSGTHWTGLFVRGKDAFYYDSYAGPPEDIVIDWLEQNGVKNLIYNDYFQMQGIEETLCGIYVINFLYYMTHSKKKRLIDRFHEFTSYFTDLDGKYSSGLNLEFIK